MSDADALMWHVERDPHLRSTIVTVLVLDRAPDWDDLVARIERGTRLIPRLRQRVVEPAVRIGPPHWSGDPEFDLTYHVRRMRAPKPRSFDAPCSMSRRRRRWATSTALVRCGSSPWSKGLPDKRAALVMKVHHSMTDGVGGMRLLLMLFDLERNPAPGGPDPEPVTLPVFSPTGLLAESLEWQARRAAENTRRAAGGVRTVWQIVRDDATAAVGEATRVAESVGAVPRPRTATDVGRDRRPQPRPTRHDAARASR